MNSATDEILTAKKFSLDDDCYVVRRPHCKSVMGIEGRIPDDILGEQYQHRACGGGLQVDYSATEVRAV